MISSCITVASKIVFRKVLSLERFFYAFLRILAQWTEILVETFGVESPLPTPVIVSRSAQ